MLIIIKRSLPEKKDRQALRSRDNLSSNGRSGAEQSRHCLSYKTLEPPPLAARFHRQKLPQHSFPWHSVPPCSTELTMCQYFAYQTSMTFTKQVEDAPENKQLCVTQLTWKSYYYLRAKNRIWFVIYRCYSGTTEILKLKVR